MTVPAQRFNVALLGARMHYAVPRILQQAGRLERFFTDFCATQGWPRLLSLLPGPLRPGVVSRVLSRVADGVPAERIRAFNDFGWRYARRRARATTPSAMTEVFLWANREFGELVSRSDWGAASAVFTFNCAGLEILQRAKSQGLFTVIEQTIAPSALEQQLLREEHAAHPGWERRLQDDFAAQYSQREQSEWPLADCILCGSEFVRDGISECGGPVERCVVVPYGVDSPKLGSGSKVQGAKSKGREEGKRLRVLTVGTVGLRKGAPYVLAAAKAMENRAEFRWVGSVSLLREAVSGMARHVKLVGAVPRTEIGTHYRWADVFLLPSICEGSATASYEALAHGLPVICTPNTGSVVRDSMEGFIVPIRDTNEIVERLTKIADQPRLLDDLSHSARHRSERYTVESYGQALLRALRDGEAGELKREPGK